MNFESMVRIGLFAVSIAALVLVSGCASTVEINSEPPGASVEVDGQYIGETPTSYTDTSIAHTTHRIVLEKRGYHRTNTILRRNGPVNSGAMAAGLIGLFGCLPLLPAWLWINDYPRSVTYRLRQTDEEVYTDRSVRSGDGEVTFVLVPKEDENSLEW